MLLAALFIRRGDVACQHIGAKEKELPTFVMRTERDSKDRLSR